MQPGVPIQAYGFPYHVHADDSAGAWHSSQPPFTEPGPTSPLPAPHHAHPLPVVTVLPENCPQLTELLAFKGTPCPLEDSQ